MPEGQPRKGTLSDILQDGLSPGGAGAGSTLEEAAVKVSLLERPRFSIKARLTLILFVFFLVSAAISAGAMFMLSRINDRVQFVALADRFANEIQSARRSEKNYLLYGTDLAEVQVHIDAASGILEQAALELGHVAGGAEITSIRDYLGKYRATVGALAAHADDPAYLDSDEGTEAARLVRSYGSSMLELSLDVSKKERQVIAATTTQAKRVQLGLLAVLLAFSVFIAGYMSRHILSRLNRLMDATQRFAAGDFLPITPQRKYKDEFSHLAIALNHMMYELERRQRILVESHKLRAIGNLTAGVAHELNNPLNNIIITAEMLKEGYGDYSDEEREDMINDLVTQGQRAEQVVKNLLDFARESEAKSEHLHLGKLIDETIRLARNQIKLSKIEFHEDIPELLPPIFGDRTLLIQVFLNVFLNAIDAMPDGGTLSIRVREEKQTGFVSVAITDSGNGIPAHILGSIFAPFFTTKPTGKGTGLGLAVSQGIIEKHGGSIEVHSKVGEGTTFTIHLPIVAVPAETAGHLHRDHKP